MKPMPKRYHEARLAGHRHYELRKDGVFVAGNVVMTNSFETLVPYAQMLPNVSVIRQRDPTFWFTTWTTPLLGFTYLAMLNQFDLAWDSFFPGVCAGLILLFLIIMIATRKRIEYACFNSDAGLVVLTIAKSGPDTAFFETFIDQIKSAIKEERSMPASDG